jgi:hypothetical protein
MTRFWPGAKLAMPKAVAQQHGQVSVRSILARHIALSGAHGLPGGFATAG